MEGILRGMMPLNNSSVELGVQVGGRNPNQSAEAIYDINKTGKGGGHIGSSYMSSFMGRQAR